MSDEEKLTAREAEEFARFLFHPDTFIEWWKPEDEFILNGEIHRRHYRRLEAKNK